MVERQPLTAPPLSDLPGRIGEQGKLFRFFKDLCVELAAVKAENELLREANGCLQERLAKLEAAHAALKEDFRKHYTYEQTGRVS